MISSTQTTSNASLAKCGSSKAQVNSHISQSQFININFLFLFLGTYIPQKEVDVVEEIQAKVIMANEALKLRAMMETKDRDGNTRVAGEEWLVKRVGAYLPGVHEDIVDVVQARVLTETVSSYLSYLLLQTNEITQTIYRGLSISKRHAHSLTSLAKPGRTVTNGL